MKKITVLFLSLLLVSCACAGLAACTGRPEPSEPAAAVETVPAETAPESTASETESTVTATTTTTAETTAAPADLGPVPSVTRVWIDGSYISTLIRFEFSDPGLDEIMVMRLDLYNRETEAWESFQGCKPGSDYVAWDFFSRCRNLRSYSKIRCTCSAFPESGYTDSVYEQPLELNISCETAAGNASAEYGRDESGRPSVTVRGLDGGPAFIQTYTGPDIESRQVCPEQWGEGPEFTTFIPGSKPEDPDITGYYRIFQYTETVDGPESLTIAYRDVSGWKPVS